MPSSVTSVRLALRAAISIGVMVSIARPINAQAQNADSLAQWIRRGYDLSAPASRTIWRELGWNGVGFGFRTFAARQPSTDAATDQSISLFATAMDYYRITLDEIQTKVDGDIGLAWGVHTEVFKIKGQPAESIRVRFTNTLRWDGRAWKNLLYHRDAQPFQANGRYVRTP